MILKNRNYLFVDGRYTIQSKIESGKDFKIFDYLKNKNKKIEKKQIKVGLKFDGMIEVKDGIKADDLIVYEGINKIRNGVEVKIK